MTHPEITGAIDCGAPHGNYFAQFAKTAYDNGYSIISLFPDQKRPHADIGWREACWSRFPEEWVQEWVAAAPDAGIGLACGRYTVAFDIDVDDSVSVEAIRSMIVDVCGETPLIRVGRPPRLALVYRSLEPIVSIRLPKFDILGLGCQLAAYGSHPTTGAPYRWVGITAPHLTALDRVPGVSNSQCLAVAENIVRRIYGDRFERFAFDTDLDLVTMSFSSRSTLLRQLLTRLFRGSRAARARFGTLVRANEIPPGFWGFTMRPVVRGGFNHADFLRRIDRGELVEG